jgi:hypothetical protein
MNLAGPSFDQWNDELAPGIVAAWKHFLDSDRAYLVPEKAKEESVSAAFHGHLEPLCPGGFTVVHTYNKMNDPIVRRIAKAIVLGPAVHEVVPDIVIQRHEGDAIDDNLLVIEMKKAGAQGWKKDLAKLKEMTSLPRAPRRFQYRFGLFLRFSADGKFDKCILFESGKSWLLNDENLTRVRKLRPGRNAVTIKRNTQRSAEYLAEIDNKD